MAILKIILAKAFKALLFIVFVVLAVGYTKAFAGLFNDGLSKIIKPPAIWFFAGIAAYIPVHIIFRRLITLHVFGHELTHALWALIFGGKVKEIYVSKTQGGYTTYTGGNFFVSLAPYFFPLYSIAFFIIYKIVVARYQPALLFMTGAGLSFHLLLTIYSIRIGQTDLKKTGVIFSLAVIYTLNCLIAGVMIADILKGSGIRGYLMDGMDNIRAYAPKAAEITTNTINTTIRLKKN